MEKDVAIQVRNVSKSFLLPHEKVSSIKHIFTHFFSYIQKRRTVEVQHVLDDVSFEIKKGEFFGIVGRNGSGKSTLLKLISGIYSPNKGQIIVDGKLTPFIELGVGFNPELTGRQNVFLNGALLGFSEKEVGRMYKDIVDFAELEKFMDQKLKNYSSGMQVRLAFSIAIRADTEILVLDEVLAVGDANFQKKCFDYFEKIKNTDKTVILVTHNMDAVERFCNKAMLIDKGEIVTIATPVKVAKQYSDLNFKLESNKLGTKQETTATRKGDVSMRAAILVNGKEVQGIDASEVKKLELQLDIKSRVDVDNPALGIIISNSTGLPIFATNSKITKTKFNLKKGGKLKMRFVIDNIFSNGEYTVSTGIKTQDGTRTYFAEENLHKFLVGGRKHEFATTSPDYTLKVES